MENKNLTTASGRPFAEFENSQSVSNRGPILMQDYLLNEDMAHFNRERIHERVVHAKGTNSFDAIVADESYKEPPMQLDSSIADWFDRNENDDDHFTQPGLLYSKG